ncbi:hypothetical protein GR702_01395 [Novosphingobium sp. FGD1]|uniref:Uncharacterized protein n=1 Tax=Novosphingobium silvae TaxID=2692619 RepID=A0A7X4K5S9_9SPHN|nr:hypothetical protein [Novosphingobium silvae]MYL96429.1 hypothetical protein [Novosphingobium silvae]
MAKIAQLNRLTPLEANGQELVPVVKNGTTRAAAIIDIVAPAAKPFVDAAAGHVAKAELAAASAAIGAHLFDTVEAGLLATPEGNDFRVRGVGDTYAEDYRNVGGVATKLPGELPSKAYMDGIAPAVNSKVMVLAKMAGVDTSNIALDSGAAIRAALTEAMTAGKTVDLGVDTFRVGAQWSSVLPITDKLILRGDGGRFVATDGDSSKNFMAVRAPIEMEGLRFENFSALLSCDTNGIDLSDHDIVLRNIDHLNCGQGLIFNTLENFRIRDLILEMINIDSTAFASGVGKGQGIRWQANGFRRAYLRSIFCRNRNYQAVRVGAYPHDLVYNGHIHMESIHVDGVISNGQSNGVQAFGYDIYVDDIFVTRVDCLNGNSSNTEAVYFAGDRVSLGNITVENASNGQGGIAVKSSRTRQHGPIRYRTRLHPRMNCAMRIDGPDVELSGGFDIEWLWEPIVTSTSAGNDAYAVSYLRMDTALTDAYDYFFVPHAVNTTNAPTLDVGGFGAKLMVNAENGAAIYPGQLRTDVIYRATLDVSGNRYRIRAVRWDDRVPVVSGIGNNIALPGVLLDGKTYWATPMTTMTAGATMTIGDSAPITIKVQTANGLSDIPNSETVTNGYRKAFYYSAADNAMILIDESGKPYTGTGRFVPELSGVVNAYVCNHPYPDDYSDALFVMFPIANTGAATLNGEPILRADGSAITSGYLVPNELYQLIRAGSNWNATRVSGSFHAIDTANGGSGRSVIKDVTVTNGHYTSIVDSISTGYNEVSNIKTLGRTRVRDAVVGLGMSVAAPIGSRAYVSDIRLSCFYIDMPTRIVSVGPGFSHVEINNVPEAVIRGLVTGPGGTVIGGNTTQGGIGFLRLRNVQKAAAFAQYITQATAITAIDSDHVSVASGVNPPSIGAGGFFEFGSIFPHLGVEPGDAITVTHEMNNTRLQFGGYCTARDTVKAFVRDPNPAGAAVDLAPGRLFITSRRMRA